ncbi:penicillin acylase family protein [Polaribacter filamentus]|uniref:Penicillin acylase family protein n=1 Tax=Polaribacter filamentus TaxID=53483 RepID=A0A2S7KZS4_9FLAO|nr:penicillin acylase family protein [Polaribacter filamentus]PQB08120.1 penicillin acylase family protein [Polaribacter filamentus]
MKFLKKALKITIVLLVLILVGGWLYSKTYHPKYDGEIEIKNLSEKVTVYFDDMGVPHINAQNQQDAYIALGYLHAQDRLWQMELIRRIAAGRLSEIFGKDLLKTDVFFAGLGIEEAAEKTIANLDKNSESYILTQAYLEGINQFIEEGKEPLEFTLVGVKKEKYTIKDIYNVFGYMAFSFAAAHKTDPLLTEVKEKLGESYFNELVSSSSKNLTIIKTSIPDKMNATISKSVAAIMDNLPVSTFIGSNSWVIAPEKAKNGKVIFANDPHIAFSQPSVWYQNHIKTPDFEIYGFNIALMPFPLLGHNSEYAYGLTMLANDDLNFYIEESNPDNAAQYKTSEGYKNYKIIDKTIRIKDEKDTTFQVKVTKHGPIMNGLISHLDDERPIAMNWIYTQLPNEMVDVSYGLSHSKSLSDFKNSVSKIHAPGLNVMYGDAKDNIAWFASAKLYQLRDSLFTKTFLNGASGKDEIIEYLPFEENPQAINPPWHYVYSANNQIDYVRGKLYPGYYQPQDRAKRIVELLEEKDDFTKEDVAKMMFDVKSSAVSEIANDLLKSLDQSKFSVSEKKAVETLENWDGTYLKNSVGATIYNRFLYEFLKATYKDELGNNFELFINSQIQDEVLPIQILRKQSVWWDDITTTKKVEGRAEIILNSFKETFTFLENQLGENVDDWHWSRVLSVEHEHAIGKAGGLLGKIFNVGPFETIGGNEVINNQIFKLDSTGYYKVTAGPSTRRIVDFSDVENSLAILPTGQSGNVFSEHYKDQAQKFLNGEFVKMKLNRTQIERSKNMLILIPKNN